MASSIQFTTKIYLIKDKKQHKTGPSWTKLGQAKLSWAKLGQGGTSRDKKDKKEKRMKRIKREKQVVKVRIRSDCTDLGNLKIFLVEFGHTPSFDQRYTQAYI